MEKVALHSLIHKSSSLRPCLTSLDTVTAPPPEGRTQKSCLIGLLMRTLPVPTQGSVSRWSFLPKRQSKLIPEESKRQWSSMLSSFSRVQSTSSVCTSVHPSVALWVSLPTLPWDSPFPLLGQFSRFPNVFLFSISENEHHRVYPSAECLVTALGEKVKTHCSSTAGSLSIMDLRGRELCTVCPALKHNASVFC